MENVRTQSHSLRQYSVSYNNVGNVQVAQRNRPEALNSYQVQLAITDRLAAADPSNADRQRDLAVSYAKLARVFRKAGQLTDGRAALPAGRTIIARLVALYPAGSQWRNDLAWFDQQIAELKT